MRTVEEIKQDIEQASAINDADALLRYATELDELSMPQADALASRARGQAHFLLDEYAAALEHFHRAMVQVEELGDRLGIAVITGSIGNVLHYAGDDPLAMTHLNRSLVLHEELGNRRGVAVAISMIGEILDAMGDDSAALEHYNRGLALYEELEDRGGIARVTNGIGLLHKKNGDYPAALECFYGSLALHKELGNRRSVVVVSINIGDLLAIVGDYPAALEYYRLALSICDELGDRGGLVRVTGAIGIVHFNTGDYPAALEHFHRTLVLNEELNDRSVLAYTTGNIGNVLGITGDYPASLPHHHHALVLPEELGNRSGVAGVTANIGNVYNDMGEYPSALEKYRSALAIYEELGDRSGVAFLTGCIIGALIAMHCDVEALELLQSMDAMQSDEPDLRITRDLHRATLQERAGDLDGAARSLQRASAEAKEYGIRSQLVTAHRALRDLALKRNDLAAYVEHNNEFTRINEEINGKDTATKLAMQAKQREIDAREREHAQHMAVLHSTLPKHIVERIARGEVVNDQHDNASVIFLDIVGFTALADRIPSGHVVHLLGQIFNALDGVCKQHNVVKIKTIGDSYMAASFDNVSNAASCALDMISALDALAITMPPDSGDTSWTKTVGDISVRIGVHCGPVTAGVIGTERLQYDIWGDTVNVASRMESSSEPGRIHVSEAFATVLRSASDPAPYTLTQRGEVEIKGKGTMTTYWLESTP